MALARAVEVDIDDQTEQLRELAAEHPDIWSNFMRRFAYSRIYHEHALEGIVLTHAEIDYALKGQQISPETYNGVRNLKLAMDAGQREAVREGGRVDMALIRRLHAMLGAHDPSYQPTRYRKDIPLHRTYFHDIAQPNHIPGRIAKLLDWAAENDPDDDEAVRFAAHFHHEYMRIFPFAEHTGITGRLLVNYILVRHGYMPLIIHATERQRYFDALRLTKKDLEVVLHEMMGNSLENGKKYIEAELEERKKQAFRSRFA